MRGKYWHSCSYGFSTMTRGAILILSYLAVICGITGLPGKVEIHKHRVKRFTEGEAKASTKFWLYTTKNRAVIDGQRLRTNNIPSIQNSNFNVSNPVRFLIHDIANDKSSEFNVLLTKAYLNKGQFNVIVVDWGKLAGSALAFWEYPTIASSVIYIGDLVGKFAIFLNKKIKVPYDNMYLVGHGLGAHIAGFAGQTVKPNLFWTIFGLNPAGPYFQALPDNQKFGAGDGYYTESINTDTVYGYKGALGQAAFFPNYGSDQPGCGTDICSHDSAFEYFAKSIISSNTFYAEQCSSYVDIQNEECSSENPNITMGGEPSQPNRSGIFYVPINNP